jgi:hypothetical protein
MEKPVEISEKDRKLFAETPTDREQIRELWGAVADLGSDEQRHHADVTRRLRILEVGDRKKFDDDPTRLIIEAMIWAMVLQFGVPLVIDLFTAWRAKKAE